MVQPSSDSSCKAQGRPEESQCVEAARLLREGGIVAFPTETVYGLGADAFNESAVRRVFRVKGRPENHPLIVHLADAALIGDWASRVPAAAALLAQRFWPGPLTLILPKAPRVPEAVTGGQPSVGLRVPAHPMALAMLRALGSGVAGPSANRFGKVSPTTAAHVRQDLGDDVDFILDGGPCEVGLESTIVSVLDETPVILRPGGVTREAIEEALGCTTPLVRYSSEVRAPGLLSSHYAPRAAVIIARPDEMTDRAAQLQALGHRVRILTAQEVAPAALFASLRRADGEGVDYILAPAPDEAGLGLAVADRLGKAAAPRDSVDPEKR